MDLFEAINLDKIIEFIPEVKEPTRKLSLKDELIWTGIALVLFFVLSMLPLYGLDTRYMAQFETLSILLAAKFGSVITLGIGPIVTGSIMLSLLKGADIIDIDTNTAEGKRRFEGLQKIFSIFFIVFENAAYVLSGALPPSTPALGNLLLLIFQLILGGFILLLLDEVSSKWGIGSGISLFITAGVSRQIFVKGLSPFLNVRTNLPVGAVPKIVTLVSKGLASQAFWPFVAIISTVAVFAGGVYFSSVKLNIPLSFGKVRGFGVKWPIKWFYTANIPVILTSALIASLQFWAIMASDMGIPFLGQFKKVPTPGGGFTKKPISGLVMYLKPPTIQQIFESGMTQTNLYSIIIYTAFMVTGATIFAYLWMNLGGQDPDSVADKIMNSGLTMPGFRRDKRILKRTLRRYIVPLAILGGITVGLLATAADILGALTRGTGILLSVMITYKFYENIKKKHMDEMGPGLRKVFE